MYNRTAFAGLRGLVATTLLTVGCTEAIGPTRPNATTPVFDVAAGGIAFDVTNGTLGEGSEAVLVKGFNPKNPHVGDAIIASFFWIGTTNIIDSVTDFLTTSPHTRVGNTYNLVEHATAGGVSMATYVATNAQHFPDAYSNPSGDSILAVQAYLKTPVQDGGILMSAFGGVQGVYAQALRAHQSRSGTGSASPTLADAGAVPNDAGALAYGVTMANRLAGVENISGFSNVWSMGDNSLAAKGDYAIPASAGSVDPRWNWYFNDSPGTWLATVLTLNPGASQPPPPPPTGDLTVTTSTTGLSLDPDGYVVTVDAGPSQAIATNGSVTFTALDAGDHSVALSGVAANCTLSSANPQTVTVPSGGTASTTFVLICAPVAPLATQLVFTGQPSNALPYPVGTIPPVKVTAVDDQGNRDQNYTGQVTIAIGRNAGLLLPGTLHGTTTVTAVNGVATFSNLAIDQPGIGYTLVATASGLMGAESTSFTILTPLGLP